MFSKNAYGPEDAPVFDENGDLYGTTYSGNTFSGTVFRLKPPIRRETGGHSLFFYGFRGTSDGAQPAASFSLRYAWKSLQHDTAGRHRRLYFRLRNRV